MGGVYLFSDCIFRDDKALSCHVIKAKRGRKTDGCWPQFHGNLTPAHDGCAAQCFEGVQRSLIILPARYRPQVATPVLRPGVVVLLFVGVPSCGLGQAVAHRPTGSTQTDRIRLPPYRRGLPGFVKELCNSLPDRQAVKGRETCLNNLDRQHLETSSRCYGIASFPV